MKNRIFKMLMLFGLVGLTIGVTNCMRKAKTTVANTELDLGVRLLQNGNNAEFEVQFPIRNLYGQDLKTPYVDFFTQKNEDSLKVLAIPKYFAVVDSLKEKLRDKLTDNQLTVLGTALEFGAGKLTKKYPKLSLRVPTTQLDDITVYKPPKFEFLQLRVHTKDQTLMISGKLDFEELIKKLSKEGENQN